jgi:hypothetical protein
MLFDLLALAMTVDPLNPQFEHEKPSEVLERARGGQSGGSNSDGG